jgi:hypothetical protein
MSWHDLRRLTLPAVSFTAGVAFGAFSVHTPLDTLIVGVGGYLLVWLAVDHVFADLRAWLRRPRRPRPDPEPPVPESGRHLDDDRPGWIKDSR